MKIEIDESTLVFARKVILASATPYFYAIFTSIEEGKRDHIMLWELNSTALKFLVDFIYTA